MNKLILIFYQGFRGKMVNGKMKHDPKGRWVQGEPRTLGRCVDHYNEWMRKTESNPKKCMEYYSNRYLPIQLFTSAFDDTPLIQLFCPPILHLLLGNLPFYLNIVFA